ncbi:unnamed protein product [Lota lota]
MHALVLQVSSSGLRAARVHSQAKVWSFGVSFTLLPQRSTAWKRVLATTESKNICSMVLQMFKDLSFLRK